MRKFFKENRLEYIIHTAMRFKGYLTYLILFRIIIIALTYLIPLINMKIIDDGITARNSKALCIYVTIFIVVQVFAGVFGYFADMTQLKYSNKMNVYLQSIAVDFCVNKNQNELDESSRGEVNSYLMRDVYAFSNLSSSLINEGVLNVLRIIASIILIIYMQFDLAIMVIVLQFFIILFRLKMNSYVEKLAIGNRKTFRKFMDATLEIVNNVRSLRLINAYQYIKNKYMKANLAYVQSSEKAAKAGERYSQLTSLLGIVLSSAMLLVGGYKVIDGAITIGVLITFMQFAGSFTDPVLSLAGISTTISLSKQEIVNISEVLDYAKLPKEEPSKLPKIITKILIKNLNFSYKQNEPVFEDMEVLFKTGKINYLMGESGAGKSTLFKLLTKDYPIANNMISFEGVDICHISQDDLLNFIGIVTQDSLIFQDTMWNNITLGNQYNKEDVIRVCRDCAIMNTINELENGFETEISENGFNISVGQKQRISLARVLLQNKDILLIDEVTSGIDFKNEALIRATLKKYCREKLIIVITHSQHFIEKDSEVYTLEDRKLIKTKAQFSSRGKK